MTTYYFDFKFNGTNTRIRAKGKTKTEALEKCKAHFFKKKVEISFAKSETEPIPENPFSDDAIDQIKNALGID